MSKKKRTFNFGKALCECGKQFTKQSPWHKNCSPACKRIAWIMTKAEEIQLAAAVKKAKALVK